MGWLRYQCERDKQHVDRGLVPFALLTWVPCDEVRLIVLMEILAASAFYSQHLLFHCEACDQVES